MSLEEFTTSTMMNTKLIQSRTIKFMYEKKTVSIKL